MEHADLGAGTRNDAINSGPKRAPGERRRVRCSEMPGRGDGRRDGRDCAVRDRQQREVGDGRGRRRRGHRPGSDGVREPRSHLAPAAGDGCHAIAGVMRGDRQRRTGPARTDDRQRRRVTSLHVSVLL